MLSLYSFCFETYWWTSFIFICVDHPLLWCHYSFNYFHKEGHLKFFSNFRYHKECYSKHLCNSGECVSGHGIISQKVCALKSFHRQCQITEQKYYITNVVDKNLLPSPLPVLNIVSVSICQSGVRLFNWYLWVSICVSLIIREIEHHFIHILTVWISFFY